MYSVIELRAFMVNSAVKMVVEKKQGDDIRVMTVMVIMRMMMVMMKGS